MIRTVTITVLLGFEEIPYVGLLHVWDPGTGTVLFSKRIKEGIIEGLAISPKGQNVATALSNGELILWNLPQQRATWRWKGYQWTDFEHLTTLEGFEPRVTNPVVFSPNAAYLVAANTSGQFSGFRLPKTQPEFTADEGAWTSAVSFAPDSRLLFSGDCDGTLKAYDTSRWKLVHRSDAVGDCISDIAIDPDGHWLATAGVDGSVVLWTVDLQRLATLLYDGITGEWLVIAPDGTYDSSPGGGSLAGWRVGRRISPVGANADKRKARLLFQIMSRAQPNTAPRVKNLDR